jgi:hypothetical protein
MEGSPVNPIQLIIEAGWVVESITSLGSGYKFHLTYPLEQVQPEVLADLQSEAIIRGYPLEIIRCQNGHLERAALAELERFLDYHNFIRIDFRILQVPPSLRDGTPKNGRHYFCRYRDDVHRSQ